jgi:hypothetical protein
MQKLAMTPVNSSSIAATGYSPERRILRVRFVGGGTYDYFPVPAGIFEQFLEAPSKGQFVNWQVKPRFRYSRVN